ncbi:MAG: DUF1540 domain-containing protein [Eubacteriales bacterium]|nr:DUF1540 domain-containing protein [Eubacteriales bacterium]
MTDLSCNACSCINNHDNCCCLTAINVDGSSACKCDETCCGSYHYSKSGSKNSASNPKLSLSIKCAAHNCIHNSDSLCTADHVDISGINATESTDTVCASFVNK